MGLTNAMKSVLNNIKKKNPNYGEVDLFRGMNTHINSNHNSCFVRETHQCYVTFNHGICTQITREISDLWIISFSKIRQEARMTFLQAKLDKKNRPIVGNGFKFSGDYFQYKLLSCRPLLTNTSKFKFPSNILSNASSSAIGSYGVFYLDSNNEVDLVFSIAEQLRTNPGNCRSKVKTLYLRKKNSNASLRSNNHRKYELVDSYRGERI